MLIYEYHEQYPTSLYSTLMLNTRWQTHIWLTASSQEHTNFTKYLVYATCCNILCAHQWIVWKCQLSLLVSKESLDLPSWVCSFSEVIDWVQIQYIYPRQYIQHIAHTNGGSPPHILIWLEINRGICSFLPPRTCTNDIEWNAMQYMGPDIYLPIGRKSCRLRQQSKLWTSQRKIISVPV